MFVKVERDDICSGCNLAVSVHLVFICSYNLWGTFETVVKVIDSSPGNTGLIHVESCMSY